MIIFDLNIQDVATQKFTLNYEGVDLSPTGDIDEMKITLSEDEEGQLILKLSEYNEIREDNDNWDKIDIQQQITIKRISDDAANGIISGRSDFEGKGFGKYYHTILTYDGNITGTRKQ